MDTEADEEGCVGKFTAMTAVSHQVPSVESAEEATEVKIDAPPVAVHATAVNEKDILSPCVPRSKRKMPKPIK